MKIWLLTITSLLLICNIAFAESPKLYAAGSLKAALSDVAKAYEQQYGIAVSTTFRPSGLLRQAIESGEVTDVFASANMKHPKTLQSAGWGSPVVLFARNQLCAIAQPEVTITSETLLEVLLDEKIRVGTSTPKADPSGDYAWILFEKAESLKAGSFAILDQKALKLTGGKTTAAAPEGRNLYGWVMGEKRADVFLTYCTNAFLAQKEIADLQIIDVPQALAVGADYGLIVREQASTEAWRLAFYILSPAGQKILGSYGFTVE